MQETLLAALSVKRPFEGRSQERTWLIGILKNKLVDYVRRESREMSLGTDSGAEVTDFETGGSGDGNWRVDRRPKEWELDAGDEAERKEFWKYLIICLDLQDPRHALVFTLREMEEMGTDEICNILGLTATNLRVMLHRVRQFLRTCLEEQWLYSGRDHLPEIG